MIPHLIFIWDKVYNWSWSSLTWPVSSRTGIPVGPVLLLNWSVFHPMCHLSCPASSTLNLPCDFLELESFLVGLSTWMNNTGDKQCPADSLCCPSKASWPKIKVLRGWRTQFPFSVSHSAFQSIKFSVPKIQLLLKARSTNIFGNNKLGLGLSSLEACSESLLRLWECQDTGVFFPGIHLFPLPGFWLL